MMPNGSKKKKSSIPDRWEDYEPVGEPLPDCRFITFKVPLNLNLCEKLEEHMRFSPSTLVEHCEGKGLKLGLVIDLTNTTRYYHPRNFQENGIEYQKIFTEGHVVPKRDVRKRFAAIVDDFTERNPDPEVLIGVHCTHGVNRTGYLVCRYMVDRLEKDADEALSAYKAARGYAVERENYIEDLRTGPKIPEEEYKEFRLQFVGSQSTPNVSNHNSTNFRRNFSPDESHDFQQSRRPRRMSNNSAEGESSRHHSDRNEQRSHRHHHPYENNRDRRGGFTQQNGYSNPPRRNFSTNEGGSYYDNFMGNGGANSFQDSYNNYRGGGQNNRYRGQNNRGKYNNRGNQHSYGGGNSYRNGYGYGNQRGQTNDDYGNFGYSNHQRSTQRWN